VGTRADELKAEIEGTRADLSGTLDEMSERVRPGRIVARRTDKLRQRVTSLRHSVMGATEHAGAASSTMSSQVGSTLSSVVDSARQTPQNVVSGAQGSSLAAGLIAFGAGLLLSSLLPASQAEQQVAAQILDKAHPAIDELRSAAQDTVSDLKDTVGGAAQELRSSAADAAGTLQDQAKSAAAEVSSAASDAAGEIKEQAQDSVSTVKDQAQS
jgi:uncharacterized protein YjbJ (UPF0337 family)